MKKLSASDPAVFEFSFPQKDTLVRIEHDAGHVRVRATRDTFSLIEREAFVSRLLREGFLDEADATSVVAPYAIAVSWEIDYSWLSLDGPALEQSRRLMVRLFVGATVLWIGLMTSLYWLQPH